MEVAEVVQEYWNEKAARAYDYICYIDGFFGSCQTLKEQ